jgi:NADPH:quinone reductase-like Zn-dependent oxidoreductase
MLAVRIEKFGPPSELKLREIATPEPGPDEVLVRISAAALNPSDVKNAAGRFHQTTLPRTPGRDFAGIVESTGARIWATGGEIGYARDGAHAEYIVVHKDAVRLKPAALNMEQAASVGTPYLTAWLCLINADVKPEETVLVIGSGGAVGSAASQIARWKGAHVIGADRRDDANIDTTKSDLKERVMALTGGRGVDIVVDTVGGPMFEPGLNCLAPHGRQTAITSTGGSRVSFDLIDFYHKSARLIGIDSLKIGMREAGSILDELARGFEEGALSPPPVETHPLRDAVAAYQAAEQGGKHMLIMA